jgi:hypothetical protein
MFSLHQKNLNEKNFYEIALMPDLCKSGDTCVVLIQIKGTFIVGSKEYMCYISKGIILMLLRVFFVLSFEFPIP